MNYMKMGTAICAGSLLSLSGCGILETVDIPDIRFDSNTYVVQPGDTLESVADRYDVAPASLVAVNALEVTRLVPGQRLLLVRQDDPAARLIQSGARPESISAVSTSEGIVVEASEEEVVSIQSPSQDLLLDDEPLSADDEQVVYIKDESGKLTALPPAPVINDVVRVDAVSYTHLTLPTKRIV